MDLKGLDDRHWWIAMVIFGAGFLVAAVTAKERDLVLIALGIVAFGFGEWRNHPLQQAIVPGGQITSYSRHWSAFGTVLDLIGIGLMGLGVYRLL